jgi:tetratricopeptide (TPR) repeat protein
LSAATDSTLRDGKPSPKVEALERRAFGEPILGPLRELGDLAAQGLWPEAIRRLAAVRLALRRLDPRLAVRLTEALYPLVLNEATGLGYQAGQNLLKAFTKAAEPLPVDARWNRLWALAWESPQGHPEEARPFWKRYLDDLDASPAIRADERPIAKAIVLAHEGREWLNLALDLEDEEPRRVVDEEATDARRTAVSLLQESLKLFPSRRETYRTLMEVYETSDQPEKAAEVAGRVLEALPEDFEALDFLGQHHYRRGEPDRALEYAIRARKLKPLDRDVLMNEVGSRVALSRRLALEGRYDEARAELAITAELNPESVGRPLSAARRACLEIKAGATEAAKAIIDEALGQLPEPAPLWLAMAIEARRIKLPQAEIDHREGLWRKAVAGKVRGETAGELAGIAVPFQAKGISYPGCEEHTEQVMDYIRRTTRIKYNRREDLANACSFVSMVPGNTDLVEKLARKGLKLFPEAPEFPMMLGVMGMVKGPLEGNLWETQKFFKSALKLAEAEGANSPQAVERISKIKEALTAIDSILGGPMGFPFLGGPKG